MRFTLRYQKIKGARGISGSLFQQGNQPAYGFLDIFLRRGNQGIIQLYGQHDQYNFGKRGGMFKMNLAVFDSLADDFGKLRLQFGDQVIDIFLVQQSFFLGAGRRRGLCRRGFPA